MAANDTIDQRAFNRKTHFRFGEDKVEFLYADPSGEVDASAFYEAIDLDNPTQVKVNAGRYYLLIALALAAVATFWLTSRGAGAFANVPVLAYVAFLIAVRFAGLLSVRIIVLRVTIGNSVQRLRIINDAKHEKIMQRLRAGWVARMRKLHAAVRHGADPTLESQRFRWLLDRKVIDEAEYQRALSLINLPAAQPSGDAKMLH